MKILKKKVNCFLQKVHFYYHQEGAKLLYRKIENILKI